jgi:hypothetical protein
MIFSAIKNKPLRITVWVLSILLTLNLLLLAALNIYVAFNKESLLKSVKQALGNNISGTLEIKDIDISIISAFPNIGVDLEEVTVLDSVYKKPFLECAVLSCHVNLFKIGYIQHQLAKLVLKDGIVRLHTDTSGYSNLSIFSKPKQEKKEPGSGFIIHTIELDNIDLLINNEQKRKDFEFHAEKVEAKLKLKDTMLHIVADQKTVIKKMIFNQAKGSYLQNIPIEGKLDLYFNSSAKTLRCEKSQLDINEQPHTISGIFRFQIDPSFHLDIKAGSLNYEKSIAALTPKLRTTLSSIQIAGPLAVQVMLDGPMSPGKIPVVKVNWQTKDNELISRGVTFDECSFTGNFTNNISDTLPHTDEFSVLTMQTFSGKWRGLQLTGDNIKITNLRQPVIEFNLSSFAALSEVENAIGSEAVSFQDGTAAINLSYNGPLIADPEQLKNLNAALNIKNGKILYVPKNILLENCTGFMSIGENTLQFKNFQFDFQKTHFTINVQGNEMSGLSKNADHKAALAFNISTPYLHLDEILQVLAPSQKKVAKKRKPHFAATANKIDALFTNSNWYINLSADRVSKGAFYGEKLRVDLKMQENNWDINRLSLLHAGGSIAAIGKLSQRNAKTSIVRADVKLQQINIQKLLTAFNNFGQNSITANNMRGMLNADAHINLAISNSNAAVIPRSMTGVLDFSLKNGAIVNHKGLEEMKLLFLKNRDMSNVRFAELKDRIDIKPEYLYINKMEIQSTAISMYLEGQYDIYGKNTDMIIQVPFSNFGKRDEAIPLKNKGVDAKTGMSIWINAKNNEQGEIKFTPRFSKKKFQRGK